MRTPEADEREGLPQARCSVARAADHFGASCAVRNRFSEHPAFRRVQS
jgi:hypothetical protein